MKNWNEISIWIITIVGGFIIFLVISNDLISMLSGVAIYLLGMAHGILRMRVKQNADNANDKQI